VARAEPDDSFDFVIVGSGTAGSLLAARLSEDPRYIPNPADRADHGTLLEVGPHQPHVEIVGDRHGLKEPFELAVLGDMPRPTMAIAIPIPRMPRMETFWTRDGRLSGVCPR
jgi:choline dehydrogenase-like flavoprotein